MPASARTPDAQRLSAVETQPVFEIFRCLLHKLHEIRMGQENLVSLGQVYCWPLSELVRLIGFEHYRVVAIVGCCKYDEGIGAIALYPYKAALKEGQLFVSVERNHLFY